MIAKLQLERVRRGATQTIAEALSDPSDGIIRDSGFYPDLGWSGLIGGAVDTLVSAI